MSIVLQQAIKELKKTSTEEIISQYQYYKPKAKRLERDEYKYLIAIEKELNIRQINKLERN